MNVEIDTLARQLTGLTQRDRTAEEAELLRRAWDELDADDFYGRRAEWLRDELRDAVAQREEEDGLMGEALMDVMAAPADCAMTSGVGGEWHWLTTSGGQCRHCGSVRPLHARRMLTRWGVGAVYSRQSQEVKS